ncbi:MAG TPA: hypothetical protein VGQ27_14130 [Steroidobacteraceae bacterium]|jgi:hypothetical protein|nr:hypothetical protein [Steroidobacteraceae bacterium]
MQVPAGNLIPFLIIVPIVIWRGYSRIKRNIGRQALSKARTYFTMTLFPLLVALFAWRALSHARPELLYALVGGIVGGIVLGYYGNKHTKFESTPDGLFYTPNAHIGIALSVLFFGRMLYRMFEYTQTAPEDFTSSPLTLGIFGLLAGYYVTYAIGLTRWRLGVEAQSERPAESS